MSYVSDHSHRKHMLTRSATATNTKNLLNCEMFRKVAQMQDFFWSHASTLRGLSVPSVQQMCKLIVEFVCCFQLQPKPLAVAVPWKSDTTSIQ